MKPTWQNHQSITMQTKRLAQILASLGLLVAFIGYADGVKFHDLTYEEAAARAEANDKIVFIDFFTTWCLPCKEMDRTTFQDPDVAAWLAEHAIALKVDAEENETNEALAARFGVKSFPNYVYLTPKGELLDRITGKKDSDEFLELSAMEALAERRDAAKQRILDGETGDEAARVFARINDTLGEGDATLALFDSLKDNDVLHAEAASILVRESFDLLVDARRYSDIVSHLDVPRRAAFELEMFDDVARLQEENKANLGETMLEAQRDVRITSTRQSVAACYQVLVGVGEHEEATSIANQLIERIDDAETLNALARAGYRAGSPVEEHLTMAREAYAQTGGDSLPIVDTLARLLAVMGRRDEAVSVAEAGLAKATTDDDRTLMEQCLEYCRGS